MRLSPATAAVLALCACGSPSPSTSGDDDSSSSAGSTSGFASTSTSEPTEPGSTGQTSSGGGFESTGSSGSSSTTQSDAVCGDGLVDQGEACDLGGAETKICDDDCTVVECGDLHVNEAAGEACDDGNVDNTDACLGDCTAASCGDGFLQAGVEECDDGNVDPGDGCDEACVREKWTHFGPATNVPVADLHLWEPCWEDTYLAGKLLSDLPGKCTGDHLLVACKPIDSEVLTVAAHGPRADVLKEVLYSKGERSQVNGVDFFWSPYDDGVLGFGPEGGADCYSGDFEPEKNLCWWVTGNMPQKFDIGYRCGATDAFGLNNGGQWQRLVFQAWD